MTWYNIITTPEQLAEVVDVYMAAEDFDFDVETLGQHRGDPRRNTIAWLGLATEGQRTDVIPMGHPNGDLIRVEYPLLPSAAARVAKGLEIRPQDYSTDPRKAIKIFTAPPPQLSPADVWKALTPLFHSDKVKGAHNAKFDLESSFKYLGSPVSPPYACTLVMSSILDNRYQNHLGLDDCVKRELGYEMVKGVGKEIEKYSFDEVAEYLAIDVSKTRALRKVLTPRLARDGLAGVYRLEMDLLEVLCDMELTGAPIDHAALQALYNRLEREVEQARAKTFAAAGRAFNLNSNPEKQKLLYAPKKEGGQGLKPRALTPKGEEKDRNGQPLEITDYSTAADALEPYRDKNALVSALLEHADLNKLQSTYVVPYLGGTVTRTTNGRSTTEVKESLLVNGRIHTDFVQYGAETGRMSSRHPNLQNVPNPRTEHGRLIRQLFIAPPGWKQVVADYSQVEPRIIASFSGDKNLIENYLTGGDVYVLVGSSVGVDRAAGKVLVLAIAYGIGPSAIASQIGCTITEAKDLMNRFNGRFPSIDRLRKKTISEARIKTPTPFVTTLLNRRRYLPELRSSDPGRRAGAERQCFNTLIQGSGADIIKLAMIRAHRLIPEEAKMILTVHDEIVTLTPEHLVEETTEAIREAMEGIKVLQVPLVADIHAVDRWADAK